MNDALNQQQILERRKRGKNKSKTVEDFSALKRINQNFSLPNNIPTPVPQQSWLRGTHS